MPAGAKLVIHDTFVKFLRSSQVCRHCEISKLNSEAMGVFNVKKINDPALAEVEAPADPSPALPEEADVAEPDVHLKPPPHSSARCQAKLGLRGFAGHTNLPATPEGSISLQWLLAEHLPRRRVVFARGP